MHIPDGFLTARVAGTCVALSLAGLVPVFVGSDSESSRRHVPLLGVTAAFVFAAQMVNFPIGAGTSGHLVGAVLATALLGVRHAIVVMTSVLVLQCLLYGDGGVLALGANLLNMGIVEPVIGGLVLAWLGGGSSSPPRRRLAALGGAAWVATLVAALLCAGELALSGTAPAGPVFTALGGIYALIGLGEAFISVLVLGTVLRMRPDLVASKPAKDLRASHVVTYGLVVSAGVALFVAPFACSAPDGLEHVADALGFGERAVNTPLASAVWDGYRVPIAGPSIIATGLAGLAGAVLVFVVSWVMGRWLAPTATSATPRSVPDGGHAG